MTLRNTILPGKLSIPGLNGGNIGTDGLIFVAEISENS